MSRAPLALLFLAACADRSAGLSPADGTDSDSEAPALGLSLLESPSQLPAVPACPEATFRGNLQRTGVVTAALPREAPEVLWARNISGFALGDGDAWGWDLPPGPTPDDEVEQNNGSGYIGPMPIVCGDLLYAAEKGGQVFALDRETGDYVWRFDVPGDILSVESTPIVLGQKLIFGALDDRIRALDRRTGTTRWTYDSGFDTLASPGYADGLVISSNKLGRVFALDEHSGEEVWSESLGSTVTASSSFDEEGQTLVVGERAGTVHALDVATGQPWWTFQTGDAILSTAAHADGRVFVGSWDNHLYALDAWTGEPLWAFQAAANITASPTVTRDAVFVGSWDWTMAALDPATGATLWTETLGSDLLASPITDGRTLVLVEENGTIHGLDVWTGEHLWELPMGVRVVASPGAHGRDLYVLGVNGDLWALRGS